MKRIQHLFVNGSLAPGRPHAHVLAAVGVTWQPATMKGYLKPQGWGADMGCPGLVLNEAGEAVEGHLFSSDPLGDYGAGLNDFEGGQYKRAAAVVYDQAGSATGANPLATQPIQQTFRGSRSSRWVFS